MMIQFFSRSKIAQNILFQDDIDDQTRKEF